MLTLIFERHRNGLTLLAYWYPPALHVHSRSFQTDMLLFRPSLLNICKMRNEENPAAQKNLLIFKTDTPNSKAPIVSSYSSYQEMSRFPLLWLGSVLQVLAGTHVVTISSGSFNVPCSESCLVTMAMTEAEGFGELVWSVLKSLVPLVSDPRPSRAAPAEPRQHHLWAELSEDTSKLKITKLSIQVFCMNDISSSTLICSLFSVHFIIVITDKLGKCKNK